MSFEKSGQNLLQLAVSQAGLNNDPNSMYVTQDPSVSAANATIMSAISAATTAIQPYIPKPVTSSSMPSLIYHPTTVSSTIQAYAVFEDDPVLDVGVNEDEINQLTSTKPKTSSKNDAGNGGKTRAEITNERRHRSPMHQRTPLRYSPPARTYNSRGRSPRHRKSPPKSLLLTEADLRDFLKYQQRRDED